MSRRLNKALRHPNFIRTREIAHIFHQNKMKWKTIGTSTPGFSLSFFLKGKSKNFVPFHDFEHASEGVKKNSERVFLFWEFFCTYPTPEVIVLKYVLCIHCYYTPEVSAAVYFSSALSPTWTKLTKKYSKVAMKCLSLPALHIICQENFVFGRMNLHSLRGILQESYSTVNCRPYSSVTVPWHCHCIKCMVPCMVFFKNLCCSQC